MIITTKKDVCFLGIRWLYIENSFSMIFSLCNLIIVFTEFFLQTTTVKVSNVSLGASERDIKEFFSFSGDIEYVEMQRLVFLVFMLFPRTTKLSGIDTVIIMLLFL